MVNPAISEGFIRLPKYLKGGLCMHREGLTIGFQVFSVKFFAVQICVVGPSDVKGHPAILGGGCLGHLRVLMGAREGCRLVVCVGFGGTVHQRCGVGSHFSWLRRTWRGPWLRSGNIYDSTRTEGKLEIQAMTCNYNLRFCL